MTKQEKIIEAYGKHWNLTNGNLNDDYSFDFIGSFSDYDLGTKFKIIFTGISIFRAIPFSIIGIEDNNGWIKIESKLDLPIERGYYFVIMNGKKSIMEYAPEYQKWIGGGHYYFEPHGNINLTHYQPINFPSDNVY